MIYCFYCSHYPVGGNGVFLLGAVGDFSDCSLQQLGMLQKVFIQIQLSASISLFPLIDRSGFKFLNPYIYILFAMPKNHTFI